MLVSAEIRLALQPQEAHCDPSGTTAVALVETLDTITSLAQHIFYERRAAVINGTVSVEVGGVDGAHTKGTSTAPHVFGFGKG